LNENQKGRLLHPSERLSERGMKASGSEPEFAFEQRKIARIKSAF
jgi:hypothetical protein